LSFHKARPVPFTRPPERTPGWPAL
jgi:hypothetical protein